MCDYSLEMYISRPAIEGETLTTSRFPSGSIGLVGSTSNTNSEVDRSCAVCVSYGTKLRLANLPVDLQKELDVGAEDDAVFAKVEAGLHHDAVRFSNGRVVLLHRLGVGTTVTFVKVADYANNGAVRPLPKEITATLEEVEAPPTVPELVAGE